MGIDSKLGQLDRGIGWRWIDNHLPWRQFGAMLVLSMAWADSAVAHKCCVCSEATITVTPERVQLGDSVNIKIDADYCACNLPLCSQGACIIPASWSIRLQGQAELVFVSGDGESNLIYFPPTTDAVGTYEVVNQPFTPEEIGTYEVVFSSGCGPASATFQVGCSPDCSKIGTEDDCGTCADPTLPQPRLEANKSPGDSGQVELITECECPKEEGEKINVVLRRPPDTEVWCFKLEVNRPTEADKKAILVEEIVPDGYVEGEVADYEGIAWVELRGGKGKGQATITGTVYHFDETDLCWKESSTSFTIQARPSKDCKDDDDENSGAGGNLARGAPNASVQGGKRLGVQRLGDLTLDMYAGTAEILRLPRIRSVHNDGSVDIVLPGKTDTRLLDAVDGVQGWVLGLPPTGSRAVFLTVSNTRTGMTYLFESTSMGPDPFRLSRVLRADLTPHSSYVYDATGRIIEVHLGEVFSNNFFALTYDALGKLNTIIPYDAGVANPDRGVSVVYDTLGNVAAVEGASCGSCGGTEHRRYFYNAQGLIERIANAAGEDLELFTYDANNRLIERRKLNDDDVMVIVEKREFVGGTIIVREPVSATEERIRIEHLNAGNEVVQIDQYLDLFAIGAVPAGPFVTTFISRTLIEGEGVRTFTTEIVEPEGNARVYVERTFSDGLPMFVPAGEDNSGWRLPLANPDNAFDEESMQVGDAAMTPLFSNAEATARFEVDRTDTYHLRTLPHTPVASFPNERMCVAFFVTSESGGFTPAYAVLDGTGPAPAEPWLQLYKGSCDQFGQPGFEHPGWSFQSGVTYTLRMVFEELPSPSNPPDGFGIDGLALTRFPAADPAAFSALPYKRIDGSARYDRVFQRTALGEQSRSEMLFRAFDDQLSRYLKVYGLDSHGGRTDFSYDAAGRILERIFPEVTLLDGRGSVRARHTFEYDIYGNLTREGETGPDGSLVYTDHVYDAYGREIQITRDVSGLQATESIDYNIFGDVTVTTDACGTVVERLYFPDGKVSDQLTYETGASGPLLSQTKKQYTPAGKISLSQLGIHPGAFAQDAPDAWAVTAYSYDKVGRALTVTDALGNVVTADYDYQGQLIQVVRHDGMVERFTYDGAGRITSRSTGNPPSVPMLTTTFVYDANGRVIQETVPAGATQLTTYDNWGRVATTELVGVSTTTNTYNGAGDLVRRLVVDNVTGQPLRDVTFVYDQAGRAVVTRSRLTAGIDSPSDPVTLTVFNPSQKEAATIAKADGNNDLTAYEPGDRRVRYVYDSLNRRVQIIDPVGTITQREMNLCGSVLSETVDPGGLNLVTRYTLDALQRPTRITDPNGHYATMEMNSLGKVLVTKFFNNADVPLKQTRQAYDLSGQLIQLAQMANAASVAPVDMFVDAVEERIYTARRLTTIRRYVDGEAHDSTFTYDGIGRPLRVSAAVNPAVNYFEREFDPAGGLPTAEVTSSPLGLRRTEFTHDSAGRETSRRAVGDGMTPDLVTQKVFDGLSRIKTDIQGDGTQVQYFYDLAGRRIQQIEAPNGLNRVTNYTFDRLGRQTQLIVSDGITSQVTEADFDDAGRRTLVRYPDMSEVRFDYDAVGRLIHQTNGRGIVIDFEYDKNGNRTRRAVPAQSIDHTFTYDGLDHLTGFTTDANNHTTRQYNALDALISETQTVAGVSKTVTFTSDTSGKTVQITYPSDVGAVLDIGYDALENATQIDLNGTRLVSYTYSGILPVNRRLTTSQGVQIDTAIGYDVHRGVTSLSSSTGATNLISHQFALNDTGAPSAAQGSSDLLTPWSAGFTYDSLARVTQADYSGGLVATETVTLDLQGNRNGYTNTDTGEAVSYNHNTLNEYTDINAVPVQYDADGNWVVDEAGRGFQFDALNQMTAVFDDLDLDGVRDAGETIHAEFKYDALGRRTETIIGGTTTRYYYDDAENVIAEYDAGNMNTPTRWFVHGLLSEDEHVAVITNNATFGGPAADYYYLFGNLFSVVEVLDSQGQVFEYAEYDLYGRQHLLRRNAMGGFDPIPSSGLSPYHFTGRRVDMVAGGSLALQYNRRRYYSPEHGRWYSRDPLGFVDSSNLYEYGRSAPMQNFDTYGTGAIAFGFEVSNLGKDKGAIKADVKAPINPLWSWQVQGEFRWSKCCIGGSMKGAIIFSPPGKKVADFVLRRFFEVKLVLEAKGTLSLDLDFCKEKDNCLRAALCFQVEAKAGLEATCWGCKGLNRMNVAREPKFQVGGAGQVCLDLCGGDLTFKGGFKFVVQITVGRGTGAFRWIMAAASQVFRPLGGKTNRTFRYSHTWPVGGPCLLKSLPAFLKDLGGDDPWCCPQQAPVESCFEDTDPYTLENPYSAGFGGGIL